MQLVVDYIGLCNSDIEDTNIKWHRLLNFGWPTSQFRRSNIVSVLMRHGASLNCTLYGGIPQMGFKLLVWIIPASNVSFIQAISITGSTIS